MKHLNLNMRAQTLLTAGTGLAVAVFAVFLWKVWGFMVDDSFIFFRYAENIAGGHGIVFNPGEMPGEGFTSWLWLLLLSFVRWLGIGLVGASKVFGILFFLGGGWLLYSIIREMFGAVGDRESRITAVLLAGVYLADYRLLAHSVSGMETSLYIFALLLLVRVTQRAWGAEAFDARWFLRVSGCVTFLFLVRPEGLAAGGISLLMLVTRRRGALLKPRVWLYVLVGLILPVGIFLGLKTLYFGYPLPLSFYHKVIGSGMIHRLATAHFFEFIKDYAWLVFPALLLVIHTLFVRKASFFRYAAVMAVLMPAVYLKFLPVMNYLHRFYISYLPLLLVLAAPGVYYLVKAFIRHDSQTTRVVLLQMVFFILVAAMNMGIRVDVGKVNHWRHMVDPEVYRGRLGRLMSSLPAGTVVANTEMGVIPYYSGLTCLDMAGLTDPVVAHRGLTMEYLRERRAALILFPRDVRKMTPRDLRQSFRNYDKVFLSKTFTQEYEFLDSFIAWPDGRSRYYLYLDTRSPDAAAVRAWHDKHAAEFTGEH